MGSQWCGVPPRSPLSLWEGVAASSDPDRSTFHWGVSRSPFVKLCGQEEMVGWQLEFAAREALRAKRSTGCTSSVLRLDDIASGQTETRRQQLTEALAC